MSNVPSGGKVFNKISSLCELNILGSIKQSVITADLFEPPKNPPYMYARYFSMVDSKGWHKNMFEVFIGFDKKGQTIWQSSKPVPGQTIVVENGKMKGIWIFDMNLDMKPLTADTINISSSANTSNISFISPNLSIDDAIKSGSQYIFVLPGDYVVKTSLLQERFMNYYLSYGATITLDAPLSDEAFLSDSGCFIDGNGTIKGTNIIKLVSSVKKTITIVADSITTEEGLIRSINGIFNLDLNVKKVKGNILLENINNFCMNIGTLSGNISMKNVSGSIVADKINGLVHIDLMNNVLNFNANETSAGMTINGVGQSNIKVIYAKDVGYFYKNIGGNHYLCITRFITKNSAIVVSDAHDGFGLTVDSSNISSSGTEGLIHLSTTSESDINIIFRNCYMKNISNIIITDISVNKSAQDVSTGALSSVKDVSTGALSSAQILCSLYSCFMSTTTIPIKANSGQSHNTFNFLSCQTSSDSDVTGDPTIKGILLTNQIDPYKNSNI